MQSLTKEKADATRELNEDIINIRRVVGVELVLNCNSFGNFINLI